MKTALPLKIPASVLSSILSRAKAARESEACERALYFAISDLTTDEKVDLLALYMAGRPGCRSFNVALASARNQAPERIAGMLADNPNLGKWLKLGLKRRSKHAA
jgi:hypothetical protein